MNNTKLMKIETKKDAIIYLNQLITLIDKRMKRLKRGINDVKDKIDSLNLNIKQIETDEYNRLSEAIESTTLYLFNLFADDTKTAVSYIQFRRVMEKKVKSGQVEFELDEISKEIIDLLTYFREQRNWSHHVPQSLFASQIDYFNIEMKYPEKYTELNFSSTDIYILTWQYHDIGYLFALYSDADEILKDFSKVFQRIKKDYSKLVGTRMNIVRESQIYARPIDFSKIAEKSFEINSRKR